MIKVLIVEDDPMVAQINKRYIESLKEFKVIKVITNGEDALKYLKSNAIDLMILDIYMPKLDGIKLLEEMRKNFIMTDVILVTASKEVVNIDEALKLGAVDYLIKPFEYERLKNALQSYLVRYDLLHAKVTFKQEDIDRITSRCENKLNAHLEKGLHKNTLKRIRQFMDSNSGRFVSAEEVAENTGLSKVTARRYLDYLASLGLVITEVEYGSVGRPTNIYKSNSTSSGNDT